MPAAPGSPGEPLILAHALGLHPDAFRLGGVGTLAHALSRAGFTVYLLAHRGDRDALPPDGARPFDFDAVLRRDVPAAVARVREHAGFPRVHWVGHGLGGQLGLAWASRTAGEHLASLVAVGAPTRFEPGAARSEIRRLTRAAELLPRGWSLPARALAWSAVPWVDAASDVLGQVQPGSAHAPRLRGVLTYATEDLPVGLLRQVSRWQRTGTWSDRTGLVDYAEALADARGPLLVVCGPDDRLCPPDAALWAAARWGGSAESLLLPAGLGHLDALVGTDAAEHVHKPLVRWLSGVRRRAWRR